MAGSKHENNSSSSNNPNPPTFVPGLCFVHPQTGVYQSLPTLVNSLTANPLAPMTKEVAEEWVRASNIALVEKFGCVGDQVEQGIDFLFEFSLSSTFNSWSNTDDGSSGISAKQMLDNASTPGAILVLVGLLLCHKDAKKKGRLTIGYNNG